MVKAELGRRQHLSFATLTMEKHIRTSVACKKVLKNALVKIKLPQPMYMMVRQEATVFGVNQGSPNVATIVASAQL